MRRSEMIKIIAETRLLAFFEEESNVNVDLKILTAIENAVMQPPKREIEYRPIPSKVAYTESNTWEPEDEKK